MIDEKEKILRDILYELKIIKTDIQKFKDEQNRAMSSIKMEMINMSRKLSRR